MSRLSQSRSTSRKATASVATWLSDATRMPWTGPLPDCLKSKFGDATSRFSLLDPVPEIAPDFVKRVTGMMIAGKGDLLPVSALPIDGSRFPPEPLRWEKRSIASEIPIWDPDICIDCGRCALVCPHAAILFKAFEPARGHARRIPLEGLDREGAPAGKRITIQVAPDDCTGCGICVEICPAKSKKEVKHKAINMLPKTGHLQRERENYKYFLEIPEMDRSEVNGIVGQRHTIASASL